MVMGSKPVFSTLKIRLRVKFGSFTFVSRIKKSIKMIIFNKQNIYHQNDYSVITTSLFLQQQMHIFLKKLQ